MFVPLTLTAVSPLIFRTLLGLLVALCVSVMAMPFMAKAANSPRVQGALGHLGHLNHLDRVGDQDTKTAEGS